MKRFKSIDIFRGIGMIYIMVGHLIDWWTIPSDNWLFNIWVSLFSPIGAAGFIFISGVSTMLSYRNRCDKVNISDEHSAKMLKNEYIYRATLILGVALTYNFIVVIQFLDPLIMWKWFIIQTVAVCLFMTWPFLKTSKLFRIFIGILVWTINQIFFIIVLPYEGNPSFSGVIFYIFYNSKDQNPIFSFFTFFLIGTIIGDIIYDLTLIDNEIERKKALKRKLILPLLLIGTSLIVIGYTFLKPDLFTEKILTINTNLSWLLYSLGIDLILFLVFFIIEDYGLIRTEKSYKFLFYFSYYSLTLFLLQNINFFLFYNLLNKYNIWFFIIITISVYGILLRFIYNKLGRKFSLKIIIGRLALSFATSKEK